MQKKRVRDTSDSALSLPLEQSDHQTRTAATLGSTIYGLSDIDILPHNEGGTQTVEQEFSSYSTAVRSPWGTNLLAFWTVRALCLHYISLIMMCQLDCTAYISDHLFNRNGLSPHTGLCCSLRTHFFIQQ